MLDRVRLGPHYRLFIGRQFSWFLISMRTYVSAHTKAIVVGRQIDRKIVARTSRFPFNKKVGQLLIEHGVLCGRAHWIVGDLHIIIMRPVALCSAKILIFNL
jgi:hypothetical protein